MKRIIDPEAQARMNITGQNIRKLRRKAQMTQQQLSIQLETRAIYICRGSVSRLENGSRIITDIELQAIAEILHAPIDALFQS